MADRLAELQDAVEAYPVDKAKGRATKYVEFD